MSDATVEKWKQMGNLYLWRYTENARNYPGWHLTADNQCCETLADLFDKMVSARWNSQKSLVITPPSEKVLKVPNNRGSLAHWKTVNSLRLKYNKKVDGQQSELIQNDYELILLVDSETLWLIKECILGILKAEGDYSIKIGETSLWFWWMLKH